MLKFTLGYFVTFLLLSTAADSRERIEDHEIKDKKFIQESKNVDYDILTLSQMWPQTGCWNLNKIWPDESVNCSRCVLPKAKDKWTLHGLWPSNKSGKHPVNCNNGIKYNPKLLSSSLRTLMEEKWASFKMPVHNDEFWSHEWSKHGTCALDLEATNSLPKYFSTSLKMLDQHNMGTILAESGIVPGNKYELDDILRVIENTLRVKVYVKCATHQVTKEQYLIETSVCFDKQFQLTDCSVDTRTNCKSKGKINYPRSLKSC